SPGGYVVVVVTRVVGSGGSLRLGHSTEESADFQSGDLSRIACNASERATSKPARNTWGANLASRSRYVLWGRRAFVSALPPANTPAATVTSQPDPSSSCTQGPDQITTAVPYSTTRLSETHTRAATSNRAHTLDHHSRNSSPILLRSSPIPRKMVRI